MSLLQKGDAAPASIAENEGLAAENWKTGHDYVRLPLPFL